MCIKLYRFKQTVIDQKVSFYIIFVLEVLYGKIIAILVKSVRDKQYIYIFFNYSFVSLVKDIGRVMNSFLS